jgi:hypothetical protein
MKAIEIHPDKMLSAIAAIPENVPVLMLNLLRYKEHATYEDEKDMPPCSGREAYLQRYVPAFIKLAADSGFKPFFTGDALASLVAPADEIWDNVALIEYPSFEAFRAIVESDVYKSELLPHRLAALEDWRLIVTAKTDFS